MKQTLPLLLGLFLCCGSPEFSETPLSFALCPAVSEPLAGYREMPVYGARESLFCRDSVLLDNRAVASASSEQVQGKPAVRVYLTPEGRELFARITEEYTGKRLGMIVDGTLLSAPLVRATISEGQLLIMGAVTAAEAERIARGIAGG
ncbi:hypothetical protein JXO52_09585 [bacterium]|nr:hypothetical protein [bacterium]